MNIVQMRRGMGASGSPLPYDAEVEYLKSVDGHQFMKLGINSIDLDYLKIKFNINNGTSFLFGRRSDGASGQFLVVSYNSNAQIRINAQQIAKPYCNSVVELVLTKTSYEYLGLSSGTFTALTENSLEMYLFGCNQRGTLQGSTNTLIYYFTAYKDNTPIIDLIPVRVGQVGYMYDKVSGQLFGNAGTGAFILGPDV